MGSSGTVTFGGVAATPSSWNNTSITVTVPSGAVTGNVIVNAGGQNSNSLPFMVTNNGDYAESIDITGDRARYEPGDLLAIDDVTPGNFIKVAEPYSTAVAGVYSTKPGVLGRRQTTPKSTAEVPMAMIGIVPVKVSSENGPIRPRDLLVSSSEPGYAMKGTDRSLLPGAVIGKAMGSLDSGTGVIEVLVTLQ
jgi:hypothetical protein